MKKTDFIKYIIASLIFGTNGIVSSYIDLSSSHIVLLRSFIGCAFLFILCFAARDRFVFMQHRKQFVFLFISGMALGASWLFLFVAYIRIGVSIASLLYYCGPVIVMAVSPFIFRDKLTKTKIAGIIAVFCGLYLINGTNLGEGGDIGGIVLALMSAVMYAVMIISSKMVKDIKGRENAALQMLGCLVIVAAVTAFTDGLKISVSSEDILPVLILGVVNTGFAIWFYFSSINCLPVYTVAVCGYTEPLSAVIFSMLFLKESMTPLQAAGVFLIIGGAMYAELAGKKRVYSAAVPKDIENQKNSL
ncbi:MAG: DMT family transporter [Oscillospiraceae bacterium]|nr:DMT family transporter [Oscillospiraceae bacterium]